MQTQNPPDVSMPTVGSLRELASMVKRCGTLHVRFSEGPDSDQGRTSIDAESGLEMPGLSANPLVAPEWWTRPLEDWLARQLCQYADLRAEGRRPWLLTGTDMGEGPDREPLLGHVRPMGWVDDATLHEAKRRYEDRFRVGASA